MGFLYKMQTAFQRFMYGRNGTDSLARVTVYTVLIVNLFALILQRWFPVLASVLDWLALLGCVWAFFRIFSKNIPKRQAENQKWINWQWKTRNTFSGVKARHADKAHRYFTCKQCRTICRVPVGKGKIIITCPKCGTKIHAKS